MELENIEEITEKEKVTLADFIPLMIFIFLFLVLLAAGMIIMDHIDFSQFTKTE